MLGPQIAEDDVDLEKLIWELYLDFKKEMNLGQIFDAGMVVNAWTAAGKNLPVLDEQKLVIIESKVGWDEFERALQLAWVQTMTPAGPAQGVQMAVVRQGCTHHN